MLEVVEAEEQIPSLAVIFILGLFAVTLLAGFSGTVLLYAMFKPDPSTRIGSRCRSADVSSRARGGGVERRTLNITALSFFRLS